MCFSWSLQFYKAKYFPLFFYAADLYLEFQRHMALTKVIIYTSSNPQLNVYFQPTCNLYLKSKKFYFLVQTLKCPESLPFYPFCPRKLQYCQPVQNQTKSQILFHKNGSPRDLYTIMNLAGTKRQIRNQDQDLNMHFFPMEQVL